MLDGGSDAREPFEFPLGADLRGRRSVHVFIDHQCVGIHRAAFHDRGLRSCHSKPEPAHTDRTAYSSRRPLCLFGCPRRSAQPRSDAARRHARPGAFKASHFGHRWRLAANQSQWRRPETSPGSGSDPRLPEWLRTECPLRPAMDAGLSCRMFLPTSADWLADRRGNGSPRRYDDRHRCPDARAPGRRPMPWRFAIASARRAIAMPRQ